MENTTYYRVISERAQREALERQLQDAKTGIDGVCNCTRSGMLNDAAVALERVHELVTAARRDLGMMVAEATDAPPS